MLRFNPYYFYLFGGAVSRLRELSTSHFLLNSWQWAKANTTYNWLLKFADTTGQSIVTLPKSQEMAKLFAAQIEPIIKELGTPRDITDSESAMINAWVQKFEATLEQEMQNTFIFAIPQVGAYSMPMLIEKASGHLTEQAQKIVGDKALTDFDKAGEALAFDLFTACGFHAMRAVEDVAREYHRAVTGAAVAVDWTLDPLINGNSGRGQFGLRDQWKKEGASNGSPLALIISLLASIAQIYRNPIMHPEMTLDYETAKEVFDTAALAINKMVADRVKRGV